MPTMPMLILSLAPRILEPAPATATRPALDFDGFLHDCDPFPNSGRAPPRLGRHADHTAFQASRAHPRSSYAGSDEEAGHSPSPASASCRSSALSAESAIQAIEAIYRGGIRAAEITMTVPGALKALEKIAEKFGGQDRARRGNSAGPGDGAPACWPARSSSLRRACGSRPSRVAKRYSKVDHAGRVDAHRSADRLGSRRRHRQDLPLRKRRRAQVHQGFQGAVPADGNGPHRRREPGNRRGFPQGRRVRRGRGQRTGGRQDHQGRALRRDRGAGPAVPGGDRQGPQRDGRSGQGLASIPEVCATPGPPCCSASGTTSSFSFSPVSMRSRSCRRFAPATTTFAASSWTAPKGSSTSARRFICREPTCATTSWSRKPVAPNSTVNLNAAQTDRRVRTGGLRTSPRREDREPFQVLRTELDSYWKSLDPVFGWDAQQRRKSGYAFLRDEIFPGEANMLNIADRIAEVNARELTAGDRRLADLFAGLRKRLLMTLGITLLLGVAQSAVSIHQILKLERATERHLAAVSEARRELKELSARLVEKTGGQCAGIARRSRTGSFGRAAGYQQPDGDPAGRARPR